MKSSVKEIALCHTEAAMVLFQNPFANKIWALEPLTRDVTHICSDMC